MGKRCVGQLGAWAFLFRPFGFLSVCWALVPSSALSLSSRSRILLPPPSPSPPIPAPLSFSSHSSVLSLSFPPSRHEPLIGAVRIECWHQGVWKFKIERVFEVLHRAAYAGVFGLAGGGITERCSCCFGWLGLGGGEGLWSSCLPNFFFVVPSLDEDSYCQIKSAVEES